MAAIPSISGRALVIGGVLVAALGGLLPGVMAQTFPRDENDATIEPRFPPGQTEDTDLNEPLPRSRRIDLIDRRLRIAPPRTGTLRDDPDTRTESTFGERPIGVDALPGDQATGPSDRQPGGDDRTRNADRSRLGLRNAILDENPTERPLSARTNPTRQLNEPAERPTRRGAAVARRTDTDVQPRIERLPRPPVYGLSEAADPIETGSVPGAAAPAETAALPGANEQRTGRAIIEDNDADAGRGLTVGSLRLFPQFDTSIGTTTNAGGSGDSDDGAGFVRIEPELRARTLWSRHQIEAELRGTYEQFSDSADTDATAFEGVLRGRIDVTERTRIDLETGYTRDRLQRGETGAPDFTENRPFVHRKRIAGTLTQIFNRLTLSATGSIEDTDYENALQRDGSVVSNSDLDFRVDEIRLRGAYDLSEKTTVFVEGFADREIYDNKVDATGFRQGSDGIGILGGATWRPSAKLELAGSIGIESRDGKDASVGSVTEGLFEGSATWRPVTTTTVNATLRQSLDITNEDGATSVTTREAELALTHQLRPNIEVTAGLLLGRDDFKGSDREDERITAQAGLEYQLTRYVALIADALYQRLNSSTAGEDDEEAEVSVGVRVRY